MATYTTPAVYVEEISTFPPSVAEVATAVPAFVGYTDKGSGVERIETLLEYREKFGGPMPKKFSATTTTDPDSGGEVLDTITPVSNGPDYILYYCLDMYFKNGGGPCYIASAGNYGTSIGKDELNQALESLKMEDEPTLILLTDAVNLATPADYHEVCQKALDQCEKLRDRFAILDMPGDPSDDAKVTAFRGGVTNNLEYGAAYTPYLETTLTYKYSEKGVDVASGGGGGTSWTKSFSTNGITVTYDGAASAPKVKILAGAATTPVTFEGASGELTIKDTKDKTGTQIAEAWTAGEKPAGFDVEADGDGSGTVEFTSGFVDLEKQVSGPAGRTMDSLLKANGGTPANTVLYNQIKAALARQRVVLPPSAAVAGIYAAVDRDRGVWKAPANVGVSAVIGPTSKITHDAQGRLNVDPNTGKSINAIRAFTGKGTLVWGARTLAGNDNEWRYVPVRRLFITIEESTKKASAFAVFEPNDATTWLKVKGMIESYLYGLWEQGALQGSAPEAAYFVNVGLGKTMTAQDVLEGRMIVEIGIAAVRPAEFIILRFTHKMPEA